MTRYVSLFFLLPLSTPLSVQNTHSLSSNRYRFAVGYFLGKHRLERAFDLIVAQDFVPPKPSPAAINHIAKLWGLPDATTVVVVGTSLDDMTAGALAGAITVLLVNEHNKELETHPNTEIVIHRLVFSSPISIILHIYVPSTIQGELLDDAETVLLPDHDGTWTKVC